MGGDFEIPMQGGFEQFTSHILAKGSLRAAKTFAFLNLA